MRPSLLSLLNNKEIHSTEQLAQIMETTVPMIEAQLAHYEQLGYVKKTVVGGEGCGKDCKKCHGCDGASPAEPVVYWERLAR